MGATPLLRRVETMKAQLNQASQEYLAAKEQYDEARVTYEVAREKFASVRRLAFNVLSSRDWWGWRGANESVQYTGLKLGDAILFVLESYAYERTTPYWTAIARGEKAIYRPGMTIDSIQEALERGGFEFRTSTPKREVNAALINTTSVKKEKGLFSSVRADEILKEMDYLKDLEEGRLEAQKNIADAIGKTQEGQIEVKW